MTLTVADRVKQTTTTISTGTLNLDASIPTGFQSLWQVLVTAILVNYTITDSAGNWEVV